MKKLIVSAVALLVSAGSAYAAGNGNSILVPQKEGVTPLLYTTEFGFSVDDKNIKKRSLGIAEKVSYTGFADGKVRPYLLIGGEKIRSNSGSTLLKNSFDPTYEVGLELKQEIQDFTLFGGLSYNYAKYHYKDSSISGISLGGNESVNTEKIFLGISRDFVMASKTIQPYIGWGFRWLHDSAEVSLSGSSTSSAATVNRGYVFGGANLIVSDSVSLGLEVSNVQDETTYLVSASLQF